MPMVTGWKVEGGNNCSKVDPEFDGTGIKIIRPGSYLVYSAVTFHTKSQGKHQETGHRHHIIAIYIDRRRAILPLFSSPPPQPNAENVMSPWCSLKKTEELT